MATSERSQQTSFLNGSTVVPYGQSLEDFLVSPFPWPGSNEAREMTAISGRKCIASSESFGRLWWWEKTLLASSAWHSMMCLLTWHHKVTKQGRSYYQLRASVPRTSERESGFWPSPQYHDHVTGYAHRVGRYGTKHGGRNLNDTVAMLPTPTANTRPNEGNVRMYRAAVTAGDMTEEEARLILGKSVWEAQGKIPAMLPTPRAEGFAAGAHRGKPDSLHSYVKMLPTPDASPEKCRLQGDSQQSRSLNGLARGKLNPAWVSRMMGFPDDYLTLDGEATP